MMRTDLTKIQVEAVAAHVRSIAGVDDELLLDCLEGETDLFELSRRLLDHVEHDEGVIAALTKQMEERQERKVRAAKRIEARRVALTALMESAKLDKLPLPEATLSIRKVPPKPVVSDPEAVPENLCRIKKTPDMAAIKAEVESGRAVPGVTLDNGGVSLTVRRK